LTGTTTAAAAAVVVVPHPTGLAVYPSTTDTVLNDTKMVFVDPSLAPTGGHGRTNRIVPLIMLIVGGRLSCQREEENGCSVAELHVARK
jgi:hypothetical protein